MFGSGVDALGCGRVGVVDPPVGVAGVGLSGSLAGRRGGGESAGLAVERRVQAFDDIGPNLGITRGEAEAQDAAVDEGGGGDPVVDEHPGVVAGWEPFGNRDCKLNHAKDFGLIGGGGQPREDRLAPGPESDESAAPTGLGRVGGVAVEQVSDRGTVAHFDGGLEDGGEVVAEGAASGGVGFGECAVTPFADLVAADEPPAVSGIVLDHPERGVVFMNVVVGVHAPHLVGAADEVDAEFGEDIGGVVQGLGKIFEAAPDENIEGAGIGTAGALNEPLGARRWPGCTCRAGVLGGALVAECANGIGGGIARKMGVKTGEILLVVVNNVENMVEAAGSVRGREDAFEVEDVGIEQEVDERLEVVGVGAAGVGGDQNAESFAGECRLGH